MKITKAAGPDRVPGRTVKSCADQQPGCLPTSLANHSNSLLYSHASNTLPLPPSPKDKRTYVSTTTPIALTKIMIKCFRRLVISKSRVTTSMIWTATSLPTGETDQGRCCDNGTPHPRDPPGASKHIDSSSAFNTIVPHKLVDKLNNLGLSTYRQNGILHLHPEHRSSTGLPAQSGRLHTHTNDCKPMQSYTL